MKKVVVGMSGGVDSSVAAYLLKEQGYEVIGITMSLYNDNKEENEENSGGCCSLSSIIDARMVADNLGIPFYVINFKNQFKDKVVNYFIDEYYKGRTPNPCIACNRYIKWQSLLQKSLEIGADYIATGHYARIANNSGRYTIKTSATSKKDQTYALFNLTQNQLAHTLMPVGEYSKEDIRKIAMEIGLDVANKPDSQEICFIPDNDYGNFLEKNSNYTISKGNFIDNNGKILGEHKGIIHYTVGQRKGLGISFGKPMFVKKILPETNEVVLADDTSIFSNGLIASDINYMSVESISAPIKVIAKIRYNHTPCEAEIYSKDNKIVCHFLEPQRAVTPGQAAVFYDDEGHIVCGGTIESEI